MTDQTSSQSDQNPGRIDAILVCAGVVFTLLVLATSLQIIWITYFPLPLFDGWDHWRQYLLFGKNYANFLFAQDNEHRVAVARAFAWVDHVFFHGRSSFLIVSIVLIQALEFVFLWRLVRRAGTFSTNSYLLLGCFLASSLFSMQQFTNLTWGANFSLVVYCTVTGAILCMLRLGDAYAMETGVTWWLTMTFIAGVLSTYSMANGLLVWPILMLLAIWLRLPVRYVVGIIVAAGAVGVAYFWGYQQPSRHGSPLRSLAHISQLAEYAGAYLGSPIDPPLEPILKKLGFDSDSTRIACAAVFGWIGALIAIAGIISVWLRRDRYRPAQSALAHLLLFLLMTAAVVASGRISLPMIEALTYRYHTAALIFWACLLSFVWSIGEPYLTSRLTRRLVYGGVVLWILIGMTVERPQELAHAREYEGLISESQSALVAGVFDPVPWTRAYHTPSNMFAALDYLRANRLSVFTEEWTRWPGTLITDHFGIDRCGPCLGHFDVATPLQFAAMPGSRVAGWAWDLNSDRPPETIVLADDSLQIVGVAKDIYERGDVLRSVPAVKTARVGWRGYIKGTERRNVTAYLLERNGRMVCGLGTLPTGLPPREFAANDLSGSVDVPVKMDGGWEKGAYPLPAGKLAPGGPTYGSGGRAGALHIGPLKIGNQTAFAIPLTTGPGTAGLSVKVLDTATNSPIASLPSPPSHEGWWFWRVDLPSHDSPQTVEIVAEDTGKDTSQRFAIGMPRFLQPPALPSENRPLTVEDGDLLVSGWQKLAPGFGAWGNSEEGVLAYRSPTGPAKSVKIAFLAVTGKNPLTFSLIHERGRMDGVIPATASPRIAIFTTYLPVGVGPGVHVVTVKNTQLRSPASQGYNGDSTPLGLGIHAMSADGCLPATTFDPRSAEGSGTCAK